MCNSVTLYIPTYRNSAVINIHCGLFLPNDMCINIAYDILALTNMKLPIYHYSVLDDHGIRVRKLWLKPY